MCKRLPLQYTTCDVLATKFNSLPSPQTCLCTETYTNIPLHCTNLPLKESSLYYYSLDSFPDLLHWNWAKHGNEVWLHACYKSNGMNRMVDFLRWVQGTTFFLPSTAWIVPSVVRASTWEQGCVHGRVEATTPDPNLTGYSRSMIVIWAVLGKTKVLYLGLSKGQRSASLLAPFHLVWVLPVPYCSIVTWTYTEQVTCL